MIVSFPFTFTFSIPGLPNPFSPQYSLIDCQPPNQADPSHTVTRSPESNMAIPQDRLQNSSTSSLASTIPRPKSLKRGWEPAFAEPTLSTTTLTSTSGYLDTPAKYREMANADPTRDQSEELPPPCKKRRGLAGSIVSTAVSAALIGTAVGLTVYRLWRDRGKQQPKAIETAIPTITTPESESGSGSPQHQLPPPPPYEERDWTTMSHPNSLPPPPPPPPPPPLPAPTPRRKVARHNVKRTRRARIPRAQAVTSPGRVVAPSGSRVHPQPEFDFGRAGEEEDGPEEQMDWIQSKLAQLIEEGKRALNREVVVMSDAQEDEVDDGSGAWEEDEEEDNQPDAPISRNSSIRRGTKRSRGHTYTTTPGHSSHHLPVTPRKTPSHSRGFSADSVTRDIFQEDDSEWQSPELRESMQKARERILARR